MLYLAETETGANPGVVLAENGRAVRIIDQTQLPQRLVHLELSNAPSMYEAIYKLRVRGAPAIGIFAAYAMAVLANVSEEPDFAAFARSLERDAQYLESSRPTAVNLSVQLKRMSHVLRGCKTIPEAREALTAEAFAIHREDIAMNLAISEFGLTLIKSGDAVMTHCNAGPLATSRYGTGLGALLLGAERGMDLRAYTCETRPLLQGARLTAWELHNAGIPVTLICDNMASIVMSRGLVNAVFVGADRIACNGDTANKIGTSGLAILAKHYRVPFYVFAPSTTLDPHCATGADIVIEERPGEEIAEMHYTKRMAPEGINFYNPAFDVTPHELITAIITEKGKMNLDGVTQ